MVFLAFAAKAEDHFGDYATRKYSIIPPSPEVASLMKYIDIPVSHYTGQPVIDIPIYTLTEGSLKVPISINYKGGGLKQNELPGIISKGWSLSVGMTLSRTVYGLPDECNHNPSSIRWMRGIFNLSQKDKDLRDRILNCKYPYNPTVPDGDYVASLSESLDYEAGYVDYANDIYKFYGQGMGGTYMFTENRKLVMSTSSPIEFESDRWQHYGQVLVDKDQTRYIFGSEGIEITESPILAKGYNEGIEFETNKEHLRYPTAWHITRMQSIYGDVIDFEYSEPIFRNESLGPSQYFSHVNGGYWCYLADRSSFSESKHKYYERSLIAIKSKSATVKFHYDTGNKLLLSISVHKNDADTTELWRYKIERDATGNMVRISQASGQKKQQLFGFQYVPKTCTEEFAIDHWGYCNGARDNKAIIPEIEGLEYYGYPKGNRELNKSYTQQGILKRIDYPTGGYTTLDWEQNDYSYIDNHYLAANERIETHTDTMRLRGTQIKQCLTQTATMKSGDKFKIDLSTYLEPLMHSGSSFQLGFSNEYEYTSTHLEPYPRLEIYCNSKLKSKYDINKENSKHPIYITTEDATYEFKLVNPRNFNGMSDIDINALWGSEPTAEYNNYGFINIEKQTKKVIKDNVIEEYGGVRIASITSNPQDGKSITKNYRYKTVVNGKTYSSGAVNTLPNYYYNGYIYYKGPDLRLPVEFNSTFNISSNGLMSTPNGEQSIEYSEVWESFSDPNLGEIGYLYDTQIQYPDVMDCLMPTYIPAGLITLTSYAYKRGFLKEKIYMGAFEETGMSKEVYKKEMYTYNFIENPVKHVFSGPLHTICDYSLIEVSNGRGDLYNKDYAINRFDLIEYNKQKSFEKIWQRDLLSYVEIEKELSYTYYSDKYSSKPWNSFVKSISYKNSRGQSVTTYYTYHKIGDIPIDLKEQEITVINGVVASAKRYTYGNNNKLAKTFTGCIGMNFSSNFKMPESILDNATYPPIDKETYSYIYDKNGNIVQINYNGRLLASYLWGYQGKHPIVEAIGIEYNNLLKEAIKCGYNENYYIVDKSLPNMFNSLRAAFKGKEISTYTYHWLLGMASATDARGITNSYLIDEFGRLSGIKDNNGYFIKKYNYNYRGF